MKIMFTSAVSRTKRPWLWIATPTPYERGLFLRPTTASNDVKRNFMYRQLHKYRPRPRY